MASFAIVFHIASSNPGFMAFLDEYPWASVVFFFVGISPGIIAGTLRHNAVTAAINRLDDDALKDQHDKMRRRQRISDIVFYILAALVVGVYLIFKH